MRLKSLLVAALAAMMLLPTSFAGAESPKLPDEAISRGDGTYAVELKEEVPGWYSAALHNKVVAAGKKGESVPIPAGVDLEVPASGLAFTGIRPGSWILFPAGCTTNFVFGNSTQIGTAGHCANVGDEVTIVAAPGVLMNIGTVSLSRNNGIGDDFALINIYPAMRQYVNPSMAHWAGPTGAANPEVGEAVVHSGHGLVIGTGGTPRAGVVTYTGPGDSGNANFRLRMGRRGSSRRLRICCPQRHRGGGRQSHPPRSRNRLPPRVHRGNHHLSHAATGGAG